MIEFWVAESRVLSRADVYEVDGPIDLTAFAELTKLDVPGGSWPEAPAARIPIPEDRCVFETLDEGDVLDVDELMVHECFVDEGPTLRRWKAAAQGRAAPRRHRTSHITVVVNSKDA